MGRYAALVEADPATQRATAARARQCALEVLTDRPGLLICAARGAALALGEYGVVLGALFTPGQAGPLRALSADARAAIVASNGQYLIHACWGGYVAIIDGGEAVGIVRAPFGELPCLYTSLTHGNVFASDVPLLEALGLFTRRVDSDGIVRQLIAGDFRRRDTCLMDVRELRGGDRLTVRRGALATERLWSPWTFVARDMRIDDRAEGDRRLRDAARYCVNARAAAFTRPLVLLSGGLDSSILAACLSDGARDFACLNVATSNATGDERHFARAVADHLGCPLDERFDDIAHVDLERSLARDLPRPVARSFEQDTLALAAEVADQRGCDVLVDGGGGDNVFGSLQSATPAADCLRDAAGHAHFWPLVATIGELADTAAWRVAFHAWRRARRRTPGYRWTPDLRFLTAAAAAQAPDALAHDWSDAPADALPGRVAHVAMLIPAQGLAEDGDPLRPRPTLSPLVSQPLIETCLRIPSWHWFARGNNRAAARRAFDGAVPETIAWRRSKGTPDSFVVEIFEAHRPLLRRALLDGMLAARGVIDADALRRALADERPARGHDFVRIMQLMDAETWVRAQSG